MDTFSFNKKKKKGYKYSLLRKKSPLTSRMVIFNSDFPMIWWTLISLHIITFWLQSMQNKQWNIENIYWPRRTLIDVFLLVTDWNSRMRCPKQNDFSVRTCKMGMIFWKFLIFYFCGDPSSYIHNRDLIFYDARIWI